MNLDFIQLVVQGGGIGVSIYAIYVLSTLVGNHINHSTRAMTELTDAIKDLKDWLQRGK